MCIYYFKKKLPKEVDVAVAVAGCFYLKGGQQVTVIAMWQRSLAATAVTNCSNKATTRFFSLILRISLIQI